MDHLSFSLIRWNDCRNTVEHGPKAKPLGMSSAPSNWGRQAWAFTFWDVARAADFCGAKPSRSLLKYCFKNGWWLCFVLSVWLGALLLELELLDWRSCCGAIRLGLVLWIHPRVSSFFCTWPPVFAALFEASWLLLRGISVQYQGRCEGGMSHLVSRLLPPINCLSTHRLLYLLVVFYGFKVSSEEGEQLTLLLAWWPMNHSWSRTTMIPHRHPSRM